MRSIVSSVIAVGTGVVRIRRLENRRRTRERLPRSGGACWSVGGVLPSTSHQRILARRFEILEDRVGLLGLAYAPRRPDGRGTASPPKAAVDPRIQVRLGEARLVALVVAVAAVAIHVDDDVAPELLAELRRDGRHEADRLRVVAVDVENRHVDHLGHVRAIARAARIRRQRGEADLVVDDDMDRAARAVAGQLRHVERLGHDALARRRPRRRG